MRSGTPSEVKGAKLVLFGQLRLAHHIVPTSICLHASGRGPGSYSLLEFKLILLIVVLLVLVIILDLAVILEARLDLLALQPAAHLLALFNLPALQCSGCVDLEAIAAGDVALGGLCGRQRGIDLEQDLREGGAEVSTIDGGVAA